MADHLGIVGDEARKAENMKAVATDSTLMLCAWCDGTGNELYAMYRACPVCGGVGVVDADEYDGAERSE